MRLRGILNIYKEKGYTSHDVVAVVRKTLGRVKAGHTGTLDPEAEGVLPVCIGKATKLAERIAGNDKSYRAELVLGRTTDTQDMTGETLTEHVVHFDREAIEKAVCGFRGAYNQVPPMYSAIKVGGKKLYQLAREGKTVERKERPVMIHEIRIIDFIEHENKLTLDVTCSKGTYIRSLCADIGDVLGCGGCMGGLLRTRVGSFCVEESIRLAELRELVEDDLIDQALLSVDCALGYRKLMVAEAGVKRLLNGNPVDMRLAYDANHAPGLEPWRDAESVFLYTTHNEDDPVGVYTVDLERGILRPSVMLNEKLGL